MLIMIHKCYEKASSYGKKKVDEGLVRRYEIIEKIERNKPYVLRDVIIAMINEIA